jgi:hypothetical protein
MAAFVWMVDSRGICMRGYIDASIRESNHMHAPFKPSRVASTYEFFYLSLLAIENWLLPPIHFYKKF